MTAMSREQHPLRRVSHVLLAGAIGFTLVSAPTAGASGTDVWRECVAGNGVSTNHSASDFADALANPPADGAEYSDCEDQIRAAQAQARAGGSSDNANSGGGGGAGSTGGSGGSGSAGGATGGTGGSASSSGGSSSVAPEALQDALSAGGIDPAAPAAPAEQAPPPMTVDGEEVDVSEGRLPSVGGALSLPLPLAASAVVVLISAALPVARYLVARFGGPPTGTTPAS